MGFVLALLKQLGLHPADYDMASLVTSLTHLCPEGDISRLSEADEDWVLHTIEQFQQVGREAR